MSGKKGDYKKWGEEVRGVGRGKVLGVWNGEGRVKVVMREGNVDVG